ncbi:DUF4097 family beta strand repeat-containing protein [Dyadobacter psychrotolerans]|uniref:DUF4097 domain-containing protein n=1 Tax=Dyadobacter psychrotolerans TaxID=2541721 RepID=A0A4R5DX82_9BACT|nr:DUF4097 family beta strand repeat protein [Dyadobacter psychrotolerans]TDE18517.1 hypothetical protein E0F88_02980 [Dyadobacter psychrotolerans]
MKTKNLLPVILAIFVTSLANAQSRETPYVTKTFTSSSLKALTVETSGGSIAVTGGQSNGFKVEMYVVPNNWNGKQELSKEETEDRLEDYDILIGTEGNQVIATAKRKAGTKWDNKKSISIGFKVYAPRAISTNIKTSGGSIKIASLTGEQNFTTSGGSLKVEDLEGTINGRTSGGSIEVSNCRKNIELVTSGGSIKATDLKGNIELKTSGGSIALNNLDGDIAAHTSGGSVKGDVIKGSLNTGTSGGSVRLANVSGSLRASTSAGSVEVSMAQLGQYLDLKSSAGSIRVTMPLEKGLDLNLKGNKVTIPLKNFDGSIDKDRVSGKLNGGGIPVTLSASSGSVYVNQ